MTVFVEALFFIGNVAFLAAITFALLFVWGYAPVVVRAPSRLGSTILGGKLALLLLALSSVMHAFLHNTLMVDLVRLAAIISVALWLMWDYIILRRVQASGKKLSWWRRWLPFDNYRKN